MQGNGRGNSGRFAGPAFAALMALMALTVPAPRAGEKIDDFDPAKLALKTSEYARLETRDGRLYAVVDVPEGVDPYHAAVTAEVDIEPYRGQVLYFRVRALARNVKKPPAHYNGVKFRLYILDGEGIEYYLHPSGLWGDFDWKEICFSGPIPPTVKRAQLLWGLEATTGHAEFDLTGMEVLRVFEKRDPDHRAAYTPRLTQDSARRGVMSPHREMTEDDFRDLRAWNVNLVRRQLGGTSWEKIVGDETEPEARRAKYDAWLEGKLQALDRELVRAEKHGVKLVIDLHLVPGGLQAMAETRLLYEKPHRDHFIEIWKKIAARYKGNPAVWAYDLINEPMQRQPAPVDYLELQEQTARVVRAIDPDTPISVTANAYAGPAHFAYMNPVKMDDIVYQAHFYYPGAYTHQGIHNQLGEPGLKNTGAAYPGKIGSTHWDKEKMRASLQPLVEFQKRHGARIYVGEFSAVTWAPGADQWIRDAIELFEEYGWDWTYHAFRESPCWDVETEGPTMTTIKPVADTARKRALLKGLSRNPKNE